MSATPLTLTTDRGPDGTAVLKAVGEIDMSNSDTFASALDTAYDGARQRLVVDLTEVDYLDSAGLSILFSYADRIELAVNPLLAPILTTSGLTQLTPVRGLEDH